MKYMQNAQNRWYKWQDPSFEPWDEDERLVSFDVDADADADVDDRCCWSSPDGAMGKSGKLLVGCSVKTMVRTAL